MSFCFGHQSLVFLLALATPTLVRAQTEEDDLEIVVQRPAHSATVAAARSSSVSEPRRAKAESPTAPSVPAPSVAAPSETVRAELPPGKPAAPAPAILGHIRISGYLQLQYEWNDLSEDQLLQGGVVLNRNRFLVRRGRIRLDGNWRFVESALEIDGSTTRGPFFGLRRATIAGKIPGAEGAPPLLRVTAGLTEIPFGYEVRLGQRELWFMERSAGSLAFFPGPVDLGVRLDGALGPLRFDLAVMNGVPLDDRAGAVSQDPTAAPDFSGRLGLDTQATSALAIAAGASFSYGTGFHPGEDATKNRIEWRDLNEDGVIGAGETVGVPGRAATPSVIFRRWAAGLDLVLTLESELGTTQIFGEFIVAQNLDRGTFVADPISNGADIREVSAYAALLQTIDGTWVVGFRYDRYDPNSDLLDSRRGQAVPADATIHTLSPLAGVRLSETFLSGFRARLVVQYDAILDALGRDGRGVPADLGNDQLTFRVQGEF